MKSVIDHIEQHNAIRREWSEQIQNGKQFNATEHAYYIIALGVTSKNHNDSESITKYLKSAFTPISNKKKLINGRHPYDFLKWPCLALIRSSINLKLLQSVSEETQHQIREMAKKINV